MVGRSACPRNTPPARACNEDRKQGAACQPRHTAGVPLQIPYRTVRTMTRRTICLLFVLSLLAGCAGGRPGTAVPLPQSAREVDVARKLEQRPISIVEELLIGEPSVQVEGREVRIRGAAGPPLWVIDGFYTDSPIGINPRDVDRLWIVPDGAGYGQRGSRGVVILQTKIE